MTAAEDVQSRVTDDADWRSLLLTAANQTDSTWIVYYVMHSFLYTKLSTDESPDCFPYLFFTEYRSIFFFIATFSVIKNFRSHLECVATLPCEILKCQKNGMTYAVGALFAKLGSLQSLWQKQITITDFIESDSVFPGCFYVSTQSGHRTITYFYRFFALPSKTNNPDIIRLLYVVKLPLHPTYCER